MDTSPTIQRAIRYAATTPTPFLLVDPAPAVAIANELSTTLGQVRYAVKSGPHSNLMRALTVAGHGFDIASPAELKMAYLAGAHPDKIICANPALSPSDIESLLRSGLRYFVADAGPHVHALAYNAKKCGIDPGELHVLIRLDFSDPAAHFQLASKFGATIDDGLLLGALITDLGLHLAGAHFHLGSQSESSNAATSAALAATKFVTTLSVANPIIDVGGGFPAPYKDAPPWRHFAQALSEGLSPATRVFCEPGRLLASAGTTLVASVISVASRQDKNFVHVDAGAYHGLLEFSGLVHGSPLETTVHVVTAFPERTVPTHLVGPTCDALDTIFAGCVDLPQLAVGDLVLFDLAGAYSTACSSPFNGFSVPTVIEL